MLEWMDKVWNKRLGALLKKLSMLVSDSFRAHITDDVVKKVSSLKSSLALIPGFPSIDSITSVLQPLDVSLNKPFKNQMEQLDAISGCGFDGRR